MLYYPVRIQNIILFSLQPCISRKKAFGILKGNWKLIMSELKYMPDIIAICIVSHNLCTINNNQIEDKWIVEAKYKLARRISEGKIR